MLDARKGSNVGIASRFDMRRVIFWKYDIVIIVESLGRYRLIVVTTVKPLIKSDLYNKTL